MEYAAILPERMASTAVRGPCATSPPAKTPGSARHQRAAVGDDEAARDFEPAALDAGEVGALPHGEDDLVALEAQPALGVELRIEAAAILNTVEDAVAVLEHDLAVVLDAHGPPARMQGHALGHGGLDLVRAGRHLAALFEADHVHLLRALAQRRQRDVDGDVAAADHHHARTDLDRHPAPDVAQEVDAAENEGLVHALDRDEARHLRAQAEEDRIVVPAEGIEAVDLRAGADGDAERGDLFAVPVEQFGRQAVGGDAVAQHAAGLRLRLEDFDGMAEDAQVVGGGEPGRAGADDADAPARRFRELGPRVAALRPGNARPPRPSSAG